MAKKKGANEMYAPNKGLIILYGVVLVVLGVVLLARPNLLPYVFGIVLIVKGIKKVTRHYMCC